MPNSRSKVEPIRSAETKSNILNTLSPDWGIDTSSATRQTWGTKFGHLKNLANAMTTSDAEITTGRCTVVLKSVDIESTTGLPFQVIPRFKYNPPKLGRQDFGTVNVGAEIFHQIADMEEFYAALGYEVGAAKEGIAPDEFVWDRYTSDQAKMSPQCLQVQMSVYLNKYSVRFANLYRKTYVELLGKCTSNTIDNSVQLCVNCPSHP
jgi:hypothetical protein